METTVKFLFLLFTCGVFASSMAETKEDGADIVDVQLIRHHEDHRIKRDAGESGMPDVIVTKFASAGEDVVLRLRRVPYLPMVVAGDDVKPYDRVSKHSSVYVDETRSASFIVKRSEFEDFILDGNLKHQGRQLIMKPAPRRRRSANGANTTDVNLHLITSESETVEYQDDDIPGPWELERTVSLRARVLGVLHTVETGFVVDYSDYINWLARFPTDTDNHIREYYTYCLQTLNAVFSSVKERNSAIDIRITVPQLYVLKTADRTFSEALNTASGGQPLNGNIFLSNFTDWIPQQAVNGLMQGLDHYMIFTAYNFGTGTTVGVAFRGAMCTTYSVSVTQNRFTARIFNTAAHELGHSLGAQHDPDIGCANELSYVMGRLRKVPVDTTVADPGNLWDFSECSVSNFTTVLGATTCTLPSETSATNVLNPIPHGVIVTDRDEQCRYITGYANSTDLTSASDLTEAESCYGMPCRINATHSSYFLPFEETPCGTDLVCQQGLCVPRPATTTTPNNANTAAPGTTTPPTSPTTTSTTRAPTTTTTTTSTPAPTTTTPTTTTTPPTTTTTTPAAKTTAKGSECLGRLAGSTDCSTPLYHAMCLHCWLWKGYRGGDCLVCFPEFGLIP